MAARMEIALDPENPTQVRAYAEHVAEVLMSERPEAQSSARNTRSGSSYRASRTA
jgi:hypothetical protein